MSGHHGHDHSVGYFPSISMLGCEFDNVNVTDSLLLPSQGPDPPGYDPASEQTMLLIQQQQILFDETPTNRRKQSTTATILAFVMTIFILAIGGIVVWKQHDEYCNNAPPGSVRCGNNREGWPTPPRGY